MRQGLTDAIVTLRMDEAVTLAQRMMAGGTDPLAVIAESSEAMQVIGRRYADGEAFIPELIMGGEIMKAVSQEVMPQGSRPDTESSEGHGRHRHGARRHPRHRQGHRGAHAAESGGYSVHDLGTDVPVEDFVAAITEHDPDIAALSGLLTLAFEP